MIFCRNLERMLKIARHLRAFGPESAIAGNHNIGAAGQRPSRQRFPRSATHDAGFAQSERFEALKVFRDAPRKRSFVPDNAIFGDRNNESDRDLLGFPVTRSVVASLRRIDLHASGRSDYLTIRQTATGALICG
jgi:hypothetical protein